MDADASVTKPRKAHSVEEGGAGEGERKERGRGRRRKTKDRERGEIKEGGGGKANRRGLNSGCSLYESDGRRVSVKVDVSGCV